MCFTLRSILVKILRLALNANVHACNENSTFSLSRAQLSVRFAHFVALLGGQKKVSPMDKTYKYTFTRQKMYHKSDFLSSRINNFQPFFQNMLSDERKQGIIPAPLHLNEHDRNLNIAIFHPCQTQKLYRFLN